MLDRRLGISGVGYVSPFGFGNGWNELGFASNGHFFTRGRFNESPEWVAPLNGAAENRITSIQKEKHLYSKLDRSVLMAIGAARGAMNEAHWSQGDSVGVAIGSSRGATTLFENLHYNFLQDSRGSTPSITSPVTTLGNLSSTVAQDIGCDGPEVSCSITCSSGLHSLMTGYSWLWSGLAGRVLVGGAEAPLTAFTLAQMKALRIYAAATDCEYPCCPLAADLVREQSMVLGEGAVVLALEPLSIPRHIMVLDGIGTAVESISTLTAMSTNGDALQRSMMRAIESQYQLTPVDVVIPHAPGTRMGDQAELSAIQAVFRSKMPLVVTPKWQIGHTFGASGVFGLLYALFLLNGGAVRLPPFMQKTGAVPERISSVMVNAAGFGGNAISIIIKRI